MLLVGEVKAVVGLGTFMFFSGKNSENMNKNGIICLICLLRQGDVFLCCALCLKSGGFGCFMVLFWICSAHESGFTGTQQIQIVPNPADFPACTVMQAEFSTDYGRRGLALVVPLGHRDKGWSGSQEFPCWRGEGN